MRTNVYSFEATRFKAALKKIEGTYHPDNRENGWTVNGNYQIGMYCEDGSPVEYRPAKVNGPHNSPNSGHKVRKGVIIGLFEYIKSVASTGKSLGQGTLPRPATGPRALPRKEEVNDEIC